MSPGFYKHEAATPRAPGCSGGAGGGGISFLPLPRPLPEQFSFSAITKVACSSQPGVSEGGLGGKVSFRMWVFTPRKVSSVRTRGPNKQKRRDDPRITVSHSTWFSRVSQFSPSPFPPWDEGPWDVALRADYESIHPSTHRTGAPSPSCVHPALNTLAGFTHPHTRTRLTPQTCCLRAAGGRRE